VCQITLNDALNFKEVAMVGTVGRFIGRLISMGYLLVLAFAFQGCATGTAPSDLPTFEPSLNAEDLDRPRRVMVFYGTNRVSTTKPSYFSADEALAVTYGYVRVNLPPHRKRGELKWKPNTSERNPPDAQKYMFLVSSTQVTPEAFVALVNHAFQVGRRKRIGFIFVHGYNSTFEDAALRTAQLSADMGLPVVPAFFTWPASGEDYTGTFEYLRDFTKAISSVPALEAFLAQFAEKTQAEELFVLAHSMGTWTTTHALMSLAVSKPQLAAKVRLVTLAAPDIDSRVFAVQVAPYMAKAGYQVNLYASNNDRALKVSEAVWGRPRAGFVSNAVPLYAGIETIDASNIETDWLGHSKYGDSPVLLTDMAYFYSGESARQRAGRTSLMPRNTLSGTYWMFPRQP
jgi:esterase/lipase superfamily enzyme